ncbi:MAG: RNA polymerase sigma factor, partial [Actinomycetota bacterium]|nr:RNA polymerase sigma factor [Actinomycetota bacterium]
MTADTDAGASTNGKAAKAPAKKSTRGPAAKKAPVKAVPAQPAAVESPAAESSPAKQVPAKRAAAKKKAPAATGEQAAEPAPKVVDLAVERPVDPAEADIAPENDVVEVVAVGAAGAEGEDEVETELSAADKASGDFVWDEEESEALRQAR